MKRLLTLMLIATFGLACIVLCANSESHLLSDVESSKIRGAWTTEYSWVLFATCSELEICNDFACGDGEDAESCDYYKRESEELENILSCLGDNSPNWYFDCVEWNEWFSTNQCATITGTCLWIVDEEEIGSCQEIESSGWISHPTAPDGCFAYPNG